MTSTELAIRQPAAATLAEKLTYCEQLAKSELLPRQYREKPANILLVMEFGEYLGLPPVASIRLIHIIDNKPVASAELIAGRVREAGHRLRVTYDQQTKTATCSIWRRDDPGFEFRTVWSWERASAVRDKDGQALTSKMNWRNYYPSMLKWRATTECARDACPEILLGVSYTSDELGAHYITDDEADDVGVMTTAQRVEHADLRRMNEPDPGDVEKLSGTPVDDDWYDPAAETPSDEGAKQQPARSGQARKPGLLELLSRFARLGVEPEDQPLVIAWLAGAGWTATVKQVADLTGQLDDFLHAEAAQGDIEEARSLFWTAFHARPGATSE